MSRTVKVWSIYGAPKDDLGHSLLFYAHCKSYKDALIAEWELDNPVVHEFEVELTRSGIAAALQDVVDETCLNEG